MSTDIKKWPQELFAHYEQNLNGQSNHPIANFRKSAFAKFVAADIPTRRDEDWKYTSVAKIFNGSYREGNKVKLKASDVSQHLFEGLDVCKIVYVNGHLDESLSDLAKVPDGITIMKVSEALEDEKTASWIAQINALKGGTEQNVFLPLNEAFAANGLYISSKRNTESATPIHIIHHNTASTEAYITTPQLYINGEQGSKMTVIETHHGAPDAAYFSNVLVRAEVGPNAHVSHYKIQRESTAAHQVSNTLTKQHRDSVFSSYVVDLGGAMVRNNLSTELAGENIETNYYGVYIGDNSQHIDNQTFIDHATPHCYSNELYKGILTDKARGVFNGKVMVREDAQKTNAFQQNGSLVLSKTAMMDAKPQLEIYADDVKCSHGATIGQLDEGSIFYLKSRGIPKAAAQTLLQKAFVGEVVMNVPLEPVRMALLEMITKKINGLAH